MTVNTIGGRMVALVCLMIGDPALAEALAQLLGCPGMSGRAIRLSAELPPVPGYGSRSSYSQKEKTAVPREVHLAAALYKVGDKDGKGAAILKAYTEDPRGFYANDARRVLAEKPGAAKSAP